MNTHGRFLPSVFLALGAAASFISFLMGRYIMSQLNCPVFACTVTPSGALVERLEIIPSVAAVILLFAGLWLLIRADSYRRSLERPSGAGGRL